MQKPNKNARARANNFYGVLCILTNLYSESAVFIRYLFHVHVHVHGICEWFGGPNRAKCNELVGDIDVAENHCWNNISHFICVHFFLSAGNKRSKK